MHRMTLVSFRLFRKNILGIWFTTPPPPPPPGKKCPYAYDRLSLVLCLTAFLSVQMHPCMSWLSTACRYIPSRSTLLNSRISSDVYEQNQLFTIRAKKSKVCVELNGTYRSIQHEIIPVSVALGDQEYFFSYWIRCLSIARLLQVLKLFIPFGTNLMI